MARPEVTGKADSSTEEEAGFLPAVKVQQRYSVCAMTINRWLRDKKMDFPKAMYIKRLRFWKLADLVVWERKRAAASRSEAA
jgi:hypothetical protein